MSGCCTPTRQPYILRMLPSGATLPDYTSSVVSPSSDIIKTSIYSLLENNDFLILWTFPRAFTFVCPTEVKQFSEYMPDFKRLKCAVVCMSTDSIHTLKAFIETAPEKLGVKGIDENVLFIDDRSQKYSRSLGTLNVETGDCNRCTFVVDKNKKIRFSSSVDLNIGRDVESLVAVIETLRKSDETGKMCPSGWKKGMETLNVDKS